MIQLYKLVNIDLDILSATIRRTNRSANRFIPKHWSSPPIIIRGLIIIHITISRSRISAYLSVTSPSSITLCFRCHSTSYMCCWSPQNLREMYISGPYQTHFTFYPSFKDILRGLYQLNTTSAINLMSSEVLTMNVIRV